MKSATSEKPTSTDTSSASAEAIDAARGSAAGMTVREYSLRPATAATTIPLYEPAAGGTTRGLDLSVVIPAFNEASNIGDVLADVARQLDRRGIGYEVLVVDDGSADDTAATVERARVRNRRIRMLRHTHNRGYGAAIRTGLAAARGLHVLIVDGDGQFFLRDAFDRVWRRRRRADVVVGVRVRRNDPWPRRVAGWLYGRVLVRALLGVSYRDVNCGFKLVARSLLEDLDLESTGALISAELLTRARRRGARIVEVGVQHHPRLHGRATGLSPHVVAQAMRELVLLRADILGRRRTTRARLRAECDTVESASA